MANIETIKRAFATLQSRYPNYFKSNTDLANTMALWSREFKHTPDGTFLKAIDLVTRSSNYFPQPHEVHDKIHRVGYIETQKIATYLGRLETYNKYKDATQTEIDTWVDVHRFIDDSKGWTTKDFKEMVATFKEQLNKAIKDLPVEYRTANGIVEVE